MFRKKIINIFLILVLSIPLLPVLQVGALLSSNQLNEEIPHSSGDASGVAKFSSDPCKYFYCHHCFDLDEYTAGLKQTQFVESKERIPASHSADIQTPPPNC